MAFDIKLEALARLMGLLDFIGTMLGFCRHRYHARVVALTLMEIDALGRENPEGAGRRRSNVRKPRASRRAASAILGRCSGRGKHAAALGVDQDIDLLT
jgi:hypothetical protein